MTAQEILSYKGDPSLALGTAGMTGLAPGNADFKNSIPAWMHVAEAELKMREAQYMQHLKEAAKAKAQRAKDLTFNNAKLRPGDIPGFVDEQNKLVAEFNSNSNSRAIIDDPGGDIARGLYNKRNELIGRMNVSAQTQAAVGVFEKNYLTHPGVYDPEEFQAAMDQWNAMPPEEAASFVPPINKAPTLDIMKMVNADRPKILSEEETFTGKTDLTGNYLQTSTNKQVPVSEIQKLAHTRWLENKDVATRMYDKLAKNPDALVEDISAQYFRTNQDLAENGLLVVADAQGNIVKTLTATDIDKDGKPTLTLEQGQVFNKLPASMLTPEQKQKVIAEYSPNAEAWFKNAYSTPMGGKQVKIGYKGRVFSPQERADVTKMSSDYEEGVPENVRTAKGVVTKLTDKDGNVRYEVKENGKTIPMTVDKDGKALDTPQESFETEAEAQAWRRMAGGVKVINSKGGWYFSGTTGFPGNINIGRPQEAWDFETNTKLTLDQIGSGSWNVDVTSVTDKYVRRSNGAVILNPSDNMDMSKFMLRRLVTVQRADGKTVAIPYDTNIKASMEAIIQKSKLDIFIPPLSGGETAKTRIVVRTGMLNGKKVVQYSDGTTEYAK